MAKLSKAQRTAKARRLPCPRCGAVAGMKCQSLPYRPYLPFRGSMQGIHKERLALVPEEA